MDLVNYFFLGLGEIIVVIIVTECIHICNVEYEKLLCYLSCTDNQAINRTNTFV
jgi:hypothetical protein